VNENLPGYARPVFIRLKTDIDVTGTFKMVKGDLRREGFDLEAVGEPVYVMKPGSSRYEPLDPVFADVIARGEGGF
jgi:citronellyl-CoA synthetase